MKKVGFFVLLSFLLSSCSLFGPKNRYYPSDVCFPLEKEYEIIYEGEIISLLQKVEGNLFLTSRKGIIYCIDSLKKEIIWEFEASEPLASPPYLGSENIYVYDKKSILYCMDREGNIHWISRIKGNITSGVAEFKDKIYLGTEEGRFFALSSESGKHLWEFQVGGTIGTIPVFGRGMIIFGCDDHNLYFLNEKGDLIDKFEAGDKIQATPVVEKNSLYFGANDHYFYCLGLKNRIVKWKFKTGGNVFTTPVIAKKRVFFLCMNNVLYCLNKGNGTILWWEMIPSRSYYHLEVVGKRVIVSSLSTLLVFFEIESGKKAGVFNAGLEVKSNSIWLSPFLFVNIYDSQKDEGKILFLKKEVSVTLESSSEPLEKLNTEIEFGVAATGFYEPEFEFYIEKGEQKEVVQERSKRNSWSWFPREEGAYIVGVTVFDDKQTVEEELQFLISNKEEEIRNMIDFIISATDFLMTCI